MLFIAHRINTIEQLKDIPKEYGVEIDLRDHNNDIILQHDPFVTQGEKVTYFKDWLEHYNHSMIILNIKSEGIEYRVLELIKNYPTVKNYFFLDSSIPMIHKLLALGETNIAVRYSEYEPIELSKNLKHAKWLWVDCFTNYPNLELDTHLKVCLVSPTLQGRPCTERYAGISHHIKHVDAVCDKIYNACWWI